MFKVNNEKTLQSHIKYLRQTLVLCEKAPNVSLYVTKFST